MRNYALAVTSRILAPLLLLTLIPLGLAGDDPRDAVPSLIPIGQVLGWVVNLIVVEFLLRRRPVTPSA